MSFIRIVLFCVVWITSPLYALNAPDDTQRAVWVNEAIVATYTYNYQNFMQRQKDIARYFTATGWMNYSNVLRASRLPEAVKNNDYYVSAVATMPPEIKDLGNKQWQATMPVLVVYTNPSYKQKQTLKVTLNFIEAPEGTGVRGFAVTNLNAVVARQPCQCPNEDRVKAVG